MVLRRQTDSSTVVFKTSGGAVFQIDLGAIDSMDLSTGVLAIPLSPRLSANPSPNAAMTARLTADARPGAEVPEERREKKRRGVLFINRGCEATNEA